MNTHYKHTQIGWVICVTVAALAALGLLLYRYAGINALIIVLALDAVVLALFGSLTVTVSDRELLARFGIGLVRKRIDLSEIRHFEEVTTPWYWGWGIRLYPGGVLYNVSGTQAVELMFKDGRRVRIGTDEATALVGAIGQAIGEPEPLTDKERTQKSKTTRTFLIVLVLVAAVIPAGVGVLLFVQYQPTRARVSGGHLVVDAVFYGERIPLKSITAVSLMPRLPRVQTRTNGFALKGRLRGYFRLARYGKAKLFIRVGRPPYIHLRVGKRMILFNLPDPLATRRLYARLKRATGR